MTSGLTIAVLLLYCCDCMAQPPASMKYGESVSYDAYFKWGLVMSRAGEAIISCSSVEDEAEAVTCYNMDFKTTKFFDNFFKMRDTLTCYYDPS
ncbi:MAG: DUF3108 domain-containing protein, partial [Tannerella sp.]|nr:DUF3108 domain-containing protein [Tannerella sp.]